jgi:hypothetical protein
MSEQCHPSMLDWIFCSILSVIFILMFVCGLLR